ncbi:Diphthamide biosynthesis [Homalodisca vitripennis]|nr:Diphthamide biosynthesis [Homalodisca vitripennis]
MIERLESLDMPAVLDCKWAPEVVRGRVLLAVANAVGEVCLFRLTQNTELEIPRERLVHETKMVLPKREDSQELLALSLDWSTAGGDVKIGVSDSQGCISVLRLDDLASAPLPLNAASGAECFYRLDSWDLEPCSSEEMDKKLMKKKLKTNNLYNFNIRDT